MATTGLFADLARWMGVDVAVSPEQPNNVKGDSVFPSSGGDGFEQFQELMKVDTKRKELYRVYEEMDTTDIVRMILDAYAETSTPLDLDKNQTIWVTSENKDIAKRCNATLKKLNVEEWIESLARGVAKMGDQFERPVYKKGDGVLATHNIQPRLVNRKEDKLHNLEGFHQDGKKFRNGKSELSYPWDYFHFRLMQGDRDSLYGTSYLLKLIRPWRQLVMSEDSTLLSMISRHPERNLFMIDVGNRDESAARKIVNAFKQAVRGRFSHDRPTKTFDHRFRAISPMEDVFIGVRKDTATRIEKLQGSMQNINDNPMLMYWLTKFCAVARFPMQILGFEGRGGFRDFNPKASLTNQDIRFARSALKIQRALKAGFYTMLCLDLKLAKKDPEDTTFDFTLKGNDFDVNMGPVSYLDELERLEIMQMRWQIVDQVLNSGRDHPAFNSYNWVRYILKSFGKVDETTLNRVLVKQEEAKAKSDAMMGFGGAPAGAPAGGFGAESADDIERVDGEVSNAEKALIHETVAESPRLQELIGFAREIFAERQRPYKTSDVCFDEDSLEEDSLTTDGLYEED